MEIRVTYHAAVRMAEHDITREEAATVIESPTEVIDQPDSIRYHGIVAGRAIGVVVKKNTAPPRIITVFPII